MTGQGMMSFRLGEWRNEFLMTRGNGGFIGRRRKKTSLNLLSKAGHGYTEMRFHGSGCTEREI